MKQYWERPKRPTRPASTPYTNGQLKAAFFALMDDSKNNIDQASEYDTIDNYCARYCPVAEGFGSDFRCPAQIREDEEGDYDIDENKCREEILKWYVEGTK